MNLNFECNFLSSYLKEDYRIVNAGQWKETKLPEKGNSYIDDDNHWRLIRVDEILFDNKKVRMAIVDNVNKKIYIFYLTHGLIDSYSNTILREIKNNIFPVIKIHGVTYEDFLDAVITIGDIKFNVDFVIENEGNVFGIVDIGRKELRYVSLI